jgi:AAA domain, putative AbiEii toxin, Type IV TA system
MLIEFSVSNFRSIREKQTLSMVAAPRIQKRDNVFVPDVEGEKLPPLLKVIAIYGPNASGKSNLIRALGTLDKFTRLQPNVEVKNLPVSPFRFDSRLASEPSRFEVHFVHQRLRYMFELAATQQRVIEERLTMFPRGQEELLYSRKHSDGVDVYEYGKLLDGGEALHKVWTSLTGPQVLFLSQAVANSNENMKQLRLPLSWLSKTTFTLDYSMQGLRISAERLIAKTSWYGDAVVDLLRQVDLPIADIKSKDLNKITDEDKAAIGLSSAFYKDKFETVLTHETALGKAEFDIEDESDGTKNLIGFSFPWLMFNRGISSILVIDEFDSSLHPKIVEALVIAFLKKSQSAQLIFTTHDTHLMDSKVLRRDQYWLTERDENGATQFRSIHDFEGREGEDIEKRYYEGRYRALPIIKRA